MRGPSYTGRVLGGRYSIGELLGEGGWGAVYSAVQMDIGRTVAIKILHGDVGITAEAVARFEREAQSAAALSHPNILAAEVHPATDREPAFVVSDLLTGSSVGTLLRRQGPLAQPRVASIAFQILTALDAAHRAGIVHRDLKPDNVFLVPTPAGEDFVKLLDFGIANLFRDHQLAGSPAFASPEQVRNRPVDPRSDLYAVGATMYFALAGRLPFDATNAGAILSAIVEQPPIPLPSVVPGLDPRIAAVVDRALQKEPSARFASAAEMRAALEPWAPMSSGSLPVAHQPPAAWAPPSVKAMTPPAHYPSSGAQRAYPAEPQGAFAAQPPMQPEPTTARAPEKLTTGYYIVLGMFLLLGALGVAGIVFHFTHGAAAAASASKESSAPVAAFPAVSATAAPVAAPDPAPTPAPSETAVSAASSSSDAGASSDTAPSGVVAAASASTAAEPTARPSGAPTSGLVASASASARSGSPPPAPDPTPAKKKYAGVNPRFGGGTFGSYDAAKSRAEIERVMPRLATCFAATEHDGPDHQFTDWTLVIDPSGNVTSARRTTTTDPHPKLDFCVISVLRSTKWEQTPYGGSPRISLVARL